jgi:ATP/maltotriose-dependent transcriptional regulator MalT
LSLPYASWLAYGALDDLVDDGVLALSYEEGEAAARSVGATLDGAQLQALLHETKGWPAAFMFSLRALRRRDTRLDRSSLAREELYNYLAHQVLSDLTPSERSFMLETSILGAIDARLLELGGLAGAQVLLQELRRRAAFISLEADGVYRYHELFREFLEHELRSLGVEEYERVVKKIADICYRSGQITASLSLYSQIGDEYVVGRILLADGNDVFNAGHLEVLDAAMKAIDLERAPTETLILCARLRAAYGLDREAEALYRRANSRASSSDEKALVAWRFASHLARRQQLAEALSIIDEIAIDSVELSTLRSLIAGTKASILSCLGDIGTASSLVEDALRWIHDIEDEATKQAVLSYGSFVNLKAQRLLVAREMATTCLEGALKSGNYELAVVVCTQLYNIALDLNDGNLADVTLDTMLSSASQGGDLRMRGIALMNMYDRAGMRGNEEELVRLRPAIAPYRSSDPKTWSECVAPTLAMEAAWRGDFEAAVSALCEAAALEFNESQRALRLAELALYTCACGTPRDTARAKEYLEDASRIIELGPDLSGARIRRARVILALSKWILFEDPGSQYIALWFLDISKSGDGSKQDGAVTTDAARKSRAEFSEFQSGDFAGWRMALASAMRHSIGLASNPLTKAEQQVARLVAQGNTSREVAKILDRSVLTVDTHVRSIISKLGAESRRDAIRRARDRGLI